MDDSSTIQRIKHVLGCYAPLQISRVRISLESGIVRVWLWHDTQARWRCPMCERELEACEEPVPERIFRCLTCEAPTTFVHVEIPYIECPEHGIQDAAGPWMLDTSRWHLERSRYTGDVPIYSKVH
jgi:hypothetical protein